MTDRKTLDVLGLPIDAISWGEAARRICDWAELRKSRVVCICNVHSLVTARSNSVLRSSILSADMATPDGHPVALMLRLSGVAKQERINGPDLMWMCCEQAAERNLPIYLYGGSEKTLAALEHRLTLQFPRLVVAGRHSPPYRALSDAEESQAVANINASGAGIVWVGLGCPKQEAWMFRHRGRISAVMVGVGAAFDYHGGTLRRAPLWMQRNGLEWLFRLFAEPRRLARRYFITNALFVWYASKQVILGRSNHC